MVLGILLFENSFINIVTITFSALILTEFLNVYSEVFYNFILAAHSTLLYDLLIIPVCNILFCQYSNIQIINQCESARSSVCYEYDVNNLD